MKPQTQSDLASQGCSMPNCDGNHEGHATLYIHGRCHPRAHSIVAYDKPTGILSVNCGTCKKLITEFQIAPGETMALETLFRAARATVWPQMQSSAINVVIHNGKPDAKLAIELGYALLTGHPIILAITEDAGELPPKLLGIADRVFHYTGDKKRDEQQMSELMQEFVSDFLKGTAQ
jgi:hypothetical protein